MEQKRTVNQQFEIDSIIAMTRTVETTQAELMQKLEAAIDKSERLLMRLEEPAGSPARCGTPGALLKHA